MANWKNISIAGVIVLTSGVCTAVFLHPRANSLAPQAPVVQQSASEKDLVLQGRAYCSLTSPLLTPMSGKVVEVLMQVGQAVKKDDVLVKLELLPSDSAALALRANKAPAINSQELMIQQTLFKLDQLERNIEETKKLEAVGLAPRNALPELLEQKTLGLKQLDNARLTLADTRRAAAEDLRVMSNQLGQTVASGSTPRFLLMRAPQDGHIIGIEAVVTIGATVGGKLCTLGVMDPMVIRGQVHESEIGRLKAGETAKITLDSTKGEALEARLTSVSWAAQDSSLAAPSYYLFELVVPNPDLKIRDGSKVQVTFKAMPAGFAQAGPEESTPIAQPQAAAQAAPSGRQPQEQATTRPTPLRSAQQQTPPQPAQRPGQ